MGRRIGKGRGKGTEGRIAFTTTSFNVTSMFNVHTHTSTAFHIFLVWESDLAKRPTLCSDTCPMGFFGGY